MTTISVVECVSPVPLRACRSSFNRLIQTRKRLQVSFSANISFIYQEESFVLFSYLLLYKTYAMAGLMSFDYYYNLHVLISD